MSMLGAPRAQRAEELHHLPRGRLRQRPPALIDFETEYALLIAAFGDVDNGGAVHPPMPSPLSPPPPGSPLGLVPSLWL